MPIHFRQAVNLGLLINPMDQCSANSLASQGLSCKKILHIASICEHRRAPVENIMSETHENSFTFRNERVNLYSLIVELPVRLNLNLVPYNSCILREEESAVLKCGESSSD